MLRGFPPVVVPNTHTLILGSFPGEASLAATQYYAHPRNQFWSLVGEVIGRDLVGMDYSTRLDTLLEHHVGLWDVMAEARRTGSLDSSIRDHASNDLVALIYTLPNLATIAFNGATAAKIGMRVLGEYGARYRLLSLPSSSAAHASVPYSVKLAAWRMLQQSN
jgi:hypoxanthine-DNA glycosylase